MKKRVIGLVLVLIMIFSITIYGDELDYFYKEDGTLAYDKNRVRADVYAKNHVRVLPHLFQIEVSGDLYDVVDANEAFREDKDNWKEILIARESQEIMASAEAVVLGSTLEEIHYAVIIYNGEIEDVEYLMINGEVIEFRVVDGILRVDSTEDINSMKLIIEGQSINIEIGSTLDEELNSLISQVDSLNEDDYLEDSWEDLQDTLLLSEETDREKLLKIEAINIALDNLTPKVQLIGTFNEFFYEGKEFDGYKGIESLPLSGVYNIYIDEDKLAEEGIDVSEELNIKLKIDGNFLVDSKSNDSFTYYTDGNKSYYILPAVQEINNEWTEITPENLGVRYESSVHPGEVYIINE